MEARRIAPPTHGRLSRELAEFVEALEGRDCTLQELVDRIGDRGFGLLLLVLALPAALPVPAPGYATPFGLLMVLLSLQLLVGRRTPWIPARLRERRIAWRVLDFSVRNGALPLRVVEAIVRPRLGGMARNRAFLAAVAAVICLMAAFMTLPIPLTNTAPSFVIFVLAAGILEEDGLVLAAGLLLAPVAAAIAVAALWVAWHYGVGAVEDTVVPWIKGLFTGS